MLLNKKKIIKILEKDILFYTLQIFSFFLIFFLVRNTSLLLNVDLIFRQKFNYKIAEDK
jgi:hypothetical protein